MDKFFAVTAKCGHVGRRFYIEKTFGVIAESKKEAAQKAKLIPRVKHDHKDVIISVNDISYEEFNKINKKNSKDPYFSCKNTQDQRQFIDFEDLQEESWTEYEDYAENRDGKRRLSLKNNKKRQKLNKYNNWR